MFENPCVSEKVTLSGRRGEWAGNEAESGGALCEGTAWTSLDRPECSKGELSLPLTLGKFLPLSALQGQGARKCLSHSGENEVRLQVEGLCHEVHSTDTGYCEEASKPSVPHCSPFLPLTPHVIASVHQENLSFSLPFEMG